MSKLSQVVIVGSSVRGYIEAKNIFGELDLGNESAVILIPHIYPGEIYSHLEERGKKVYPIYDGEIIEGGSIYIGMENPIIPKNNILGLKQELEIGQRNGDYKFFLRKRVNEETVDRAFCAIAHTFKEKCIGVILYGSGDDGVKGMNRIKEVGGKTLVQEVDVMADKGTMPWHVLNNCDVDYVLPVNKLRDKLEEMLNPKLIKTLKYPYSSYIL